MIKIEPMFEEDHQYLMYIDEHRANVSKIWSAMEKLCTGEFWLDQFAVSTIDALINDHDESKYEAEEFHGYRQFFYPNKPSEKNKLLFDISWNHHYHKNKHHWEYWVTVKGFVLTMPFIYAFEMLCDWSAMSLKVSDKPSAFYEKNASKMILAADTIQVIENWIPLFDKAVANITGKEFLNNYKDLYVDGQKNDK